MKKDLHELGIVASMGESSRTLVVNKLIFVLEVKSTLSFIYANPLTWW